MGQFWTRGVVMDCTTVPPAVAVGYSNLAAYDTCVHSKGWGIDWRFEENLRQCGDLSAQHTSLHMCTRGTALLVDWTLSTC